MKSDRHILIVGGGQGIGNVFAQYCVQKGWRVSSVSRTGKLNAPEIHSILGDVTSELDFHNALKIAVDHNGPLTSLAFFQRARGDGEMWKEHMEVSVQSIDRAITQSLDFFKNEGDKSIAIACSTAALFVATEQNAAYHASRSAQIGLMRYLAWKLGPHKIRINCISIGTIIKPENEAFYQSPSEKKSRCVKASPLGRMGNSLEVAAAAEFLCCESSSWITGQNLVCDGGVSLPWPESI